MKCVNGIRLHGTERVDGPEQALRSGALGWAVPSTAPQNTHSRSCGFEICKAGRMVPSRILTFSHLPFSTIVCLMAAPPMWMAGLAMRCQKCLETPTQWSPTHVNAECATLRSRPESLWVQWGSRGSSKRASSSAFTSQLGKSKCWQQVTIYRACKSPLLQSGWRV